MKELLRGKYLALYNQVGLYDTQDSDSYPQWETGLELAVFGRKGVAVAAKGDTYVEVIIYAGKREIRDMRFYARGEILVGKKGLTVGNEIAGTSDHIDWKEGHTSVTVYGNGPQNEATTIVFILEEGDKSMT